MKKIIYILVLSITVLSCGGGSDTPPVPENNAPSQPTLKYPSNNLLCIDNVIDFDWNASIDPDGDVVTYQVQVATDAQFTQLAHSINSNSTLTTISLEKGIAYYWRVKAIDSKNLVSDYSVANQFYTEGEGVSNHLPFSPELINPTLNSVVTEASTNLQWTASDVDTQDSLTFDVYFSTNNPPQEKVATSISENNLNVNLTASTTYYWKVIVNDGNGGQTIGQVWNFTTD